MAYPALTLPYTDADLTNFRTIIFEVGGGGDLTANVDLPQATGGLTYGYYNYKTAGAGVSDSLAQAVADALTAADAQTWTPSEATTGMPGRVKLTRGGSPATVEIKWNDGSTTFPAEWLGYNSASSSSGTSTVTGTWPAGRMFIPPRSIWSEARPERTVLSTMSYSGRVEARTLTQGYSRYRLRFPLLSPARLLLWFGADGDWYQHVPDLVQNDPNTAFEALWRWMDRRAPLRYHPDRDTDATYTTMRVAEPAFLSKLMERITDPHEAGSNPHSTLDFEALEYVT